MEKKFSRRFFLVAHPDSKREVESLLSTTLGGEWELTDPHRTGEPTGVVVTSAQVTEEDFSRVVKAFPRSVLQRLQAILVSGMAEGYERPFEDALPKGVEGVLEQKKTPVLWVADPTLAEALFLGGAQVRVPAEVAESLWKRLFSEGKELPDKDHPWFF